MPSSRKSHEKLKRKKRTKNDSESSSDDEMNLKKELHPIGYYINDRAEMIRQVFKVIKGNKLRAMMTSQLRDLDMDTLKTLCFEQLEGMSRKRILHIIAGKELEESSDTDEDGSESDGDPVELNDSFFSVNHAESSKRLSSTESGDDVNKISKAKRTESFSSSAKADGEEKDDSKKKMELLELEMRARAIKSLLNVETENDGDQPEVDKPKTDQPYLDQPETKSKLGDDKPKSVDEDKNEIEKNGKPINIDLTKSKEALQKVEAEKRKKSDEEMEAKRKAAEEEKKLQKAREALWASEARKREEEEALERKHAEIRKKLEDELKIKQAEEALAKKKAIAEAEKARKKAAKEAEHQKFLKWKEEKLQRELQQDEQKARENLKRKASEMKEEELRRKFEREELTKSIEMKKRKIDRECVEDDLDRPGFESRHKKEEADGPKKEGGTRNLGPKKRRYRKKGTFEDGELGDDVDSRSDFSESSRSYSSNYSRNPSRSRSRSRSNSGTPTLSESDNEDEKVEDSRKDRLKRVKEIRDSKRKRKPESDIEEGEVDSEGETFEPIRENSNKIGETSDKSVKSLKRANKIIGDEKPISTENASNEIDETKPDPKSESSPVHDEFLEMETDPLKDFFRHNDDEEKEDVKDDDGVAEADANVDDADEREEQKRVDKMEKLREMRLRRMQAFQARTEIQEKMDESEEEEPKPPVPPKDFYKSFLEEEKRRAKEEEEKKKEAEMEQENKSEVEKSKTELEDTAEVDAKKSKKRKNIKEKSSEEKLLEGVAYWSKMCEEKGDFETSTLQKSAECDDTSLAQKESELADAVQNDDAMPSASVQQKDVKMLMTTTSKVSVQKSFSKSARLRAFKRDVAGDSKALTRSRKDLPTKQDVDADQELDQVTWADRWFQNSKVQKVVKDSKMLSKVRTSIKVRLNKPAENPSEDAPNPGTSKESADGSKDTDASLPAVIGSMEEYAKIVGKTVEAIEDERVEPILQGANSSDEEADEDEDDGLWGAIMSSAK